MNFNLKKSNNQILVYIKQEPQDICVKRSVLPSSDGLKAWVIIEPATELKAGWKLDVTDCIRPSDKGLYVEAIRGAQKAIKIDLANKEYTLSKLTNDEAQQLINLKIFKAHYGNILKDLLNAIKPYLIGLAIVVIVSVVFSGYGVYLTSKIPAIYVPVPVVK